MHIFLSLSQWLSWKYTRIPQVGWLIERKRVTGRSQMPKSIKSESSNIQITIWKTIIFPFCLYCMFMLSKWNILCILFLGFVNVLFLELLHTWNKENLVVTWLSFHIFFFTNDPKMNFFNIGSIPCLTINTCYIIVA